MPDKNLPTPGLFVTDGLKDLFNSSINQLRADLGRVLTVFFEPTASGCPNCFAGPDGSSNGVYDVANPFPAGQFNKTFPDGATCPVCQGSHKILTQQSATYQVLRKWNPENFDATQYGAVPANVVRTKTDIAARTDFKRAVKAELEGETLVRIVDPIPAGLAPPQFVVAFWKKQD